MSAKAATAIREPVADSLDGRTRAARRYGELVREEIAQTVTKQSEMEEELRHLFAALRS